MYRYHLNHDIVNDYVYAFVVAATHMVGPQVTQHNGRGVFVSIFGASPITCGVTWFLLNSVLGIRADSLPCHFLWALYFLKNYTTEEVTWKFCGNPSNKTLREKIW
jgi:hypothetical protein